MNLAITSDSNGLVLDKPVSALLSALIYFDLFDHPLLQSELFYFAHFESITPEICHKSLAELFQAGVTEQSGEFVFLAGRGELVAKRQERNARAENMSGKAKRFSRLISRFPFVRSVSISGSLSKGTMDKDGDIDYFIITEPRRLWLCRSMLVFYKKIFLLNSRKHFCVNYFIDTDHLLIPDFNLFTATEISFIKPMYGKTVHQQFLLNNNWINDFYPNKNGHHAGHELADTKPGTLKKITERIFSGSFGEWLDTQLFRITLNRWKKKFAHIREEQFDLNFRSRKSVSKHHPNGFQWKVKKRYHERIADIEKSHNLKLHVAFWEKQNSIR